MTAPRPYLTFSLRTFFVLLTIGCVWLAILAERAREQRETVKAIEALGGYVIYDWELRHLSAVANKGSGQSAEPKPAGPAWLRQLLGDDYFQVVKMAGFNHAKDADISKAIPQLQRFHGLEVVDIPFSETSANKLRAALPKCDVRLEY